MKFFSDEGWVNNGLLVLGALGTFVGIGSWLTQDALLLLAFVAGAGWMLAIPLLVIIRYKSNDLAQTQTDLKSLREASETEARDLRQQISEWRTIATQDSESLNRFVSRAIEMPVVQPRRSAAPVVVPEAEGSD